MPQMKPMSWTLLLLFSVGFLILLSCLLSVKLINTLPTPTPSREPFYWAW